MPAIKIVNIIIILLFLLGAVGIVIGIWYIFLSARDKIRHLFGDSKELDNRERRYRQRRRRERDATLCSHCGHELPEPKFPFCTKCGEPVNPEEDFPD